MIQSWQNLEKNRYHSLLLKTSRLATSVDNYCFCITSTSFNKTFNNTILAKLKKSLLFSVVENISSRNISR